MIKRYVLVVLALFVAACGGSSGADVDSETAEQLAEWTEAAEAMDNAQPCADVFAPGRPTADVLADNDAGPCTTGDDDDLFIGMVMSWDCPDGTRVNVVSEYGWGKTDGVWQPPPEPYRDCVLPGTDAQHP